MRFPLIDKIILWCLAKAFAVIVALTAGIKGRRMSHNKGVSFKGKVKITPSPNFPENDFFEPRKEFDCRVRFASISFEDSEMVQVRGASIKFSDTRFKSPFDISMNTGKTSLFWSAANFMFFASKRNAKHGIQYNTYYDVRPDGLKAAKEGLRIKSESYCKLHYYSQTPTLFYSKSGKKYYCTYRLLPEDFGPESGIDLNHVKNFKGNQRMVGTGTDTIERKFYDNYTPPIMPVERGRNYLEKEMGKRLHKDGKIIMQLQIQLREPTDNDDPEIFNSNKFWNHAKFPFHQLATVELTEQLDYEENQWLGFSSANHPLSLGNITAQSIYDYNSLNYMRAHVDLAIKVRMLSYKIFGVPKQIEDIGPRNRMFGEKE